MYGKIWICFAELMIPIALLNELCGKAFVTTSEVTYHAKQLYGKPRDNAAYPKHNEEEEPPLLTETT